MKALGMIALAAMLGTAGPAMAAEPAACTAGVKMVVMLKHKPGMTHQQFRDYYESSHVPLVMKHIGRFMSDYRRNYIANGAFDVVTEMSFASKADMAAMGAAGQAPDVKALMDADTANFLDKGATVTYLVDECRNAM